MTKENVKKFLLSHKRYIATFAFILPVVIILFAINFTQIVKASFGTWGDTSLIHACKDSRGVVFLVASNATCDESETQVTWLKDVDAGDGIVATRTSSGVTLSLATNSGTLRYESGGTGLSSPTGSWQDVSALAVTRTFKEGTIKATFAGSIVRKSGDGTAYIRLKVQKTGGSAAYVGDETVYRSSSASSSEESNVGFTVQKVISVDADEYTITPQVNINNSNWGLYYQNSLIVEQ